MLTPYLYLLAALHGGGPTGHTGPVYSGRGGGLHVTVPRLDARIVVDGNLDEPVWADAALLNGFSQHLPVDGLPAADSTEVLVWYGPDAIYFGIRAYEPHGAVVRATLANRDNIDADDNIQILLDTYNDHRRALNFAVNPLGVQEDGVRSEGGAMIMGAGINMTADGAIVDLNPDFTWESRGHLTPWGYQVEVRIPFKSIPYQSASPQDWGIQVVREVTHSGYEETWTPALRANASFLIQSGQLVGLHDLHRGIVMELNPELTGRVTGDSAGARYGYRGTPAVGGTLRWGLTTNLSLAATVHPDFSQVEADVAQVTLNQRFALFYPEKRPFFLDGLDQYDTPNTLIYTRQIVQPVAGAKLTGKDGATNIAFLSAVDQVDPATGANPIFDVLRLRRDIGASSTVGMAYTDRIESKAYNRVIEGDTRVVWGGIWYSQLAVAGSWTHDPAGSGTGALWDAVLGDRSGKSFGTHLEVTGVSPAFSAASGFVNRTDYVNVVFYNRMTFDGHPGALVEQVNLNAGAQPLWRYGEFGSSHGAIEGGENFSASAQVRGGWFLSGQIRNNLQRFNVADYAGYRVDRGIDTVGFVVPHGLYNLKTGGLNVSTPTRALTLNASVSYGADVIFAEASEGRELNGQLGLTWHPTDGLRFEGSFVHDRLTRARDGSEFAVTDIPRLKIEYQLTRSLFVRYIGQYVASREAALEDPGTGAPLLNYDPGSGTYSPAAGGRSNAFRSDVLVSYRPTPGTVLFLGYGQSLTEPTAFAFSLHDLHRLNDGFFLKGSYLLRL